MEAVIHWLSSVIKVYKYDISRRLKELLKIAMKAILTIITAQPIGL